MLVHRPIELAAVVTTADGRVLGFTGIDTCREWLARNTGWTVWTAEAFWKREQQERQKP